MWLKNLNVFQANEQLPWSAAEIEEKLEQALCPPCGSQTLSTEGFAPPLKGQDRMAYSTDGLVYLLHQETKRLLPAAVVAEEVEDRVAAIAQEQNREVGRRERGELKDQVVFELLPQAFTRSRFTAVVLDLRKNQVWVDTSATNRAEQITSKLREALGTLPIEPLTLKTPPELQMTHWLIQPEDLPEGLSLGDRCEFKDRGETRGSVRCTQVDLSAEQVLAHLEHDMEVTKLNLCWQDWLEFDLTEQLVIKRISALDQMNDDLEALDPADATEELLSILAMQGGAIRMLVSRLQSLEVAGAVA